MKQIELRDLIGGLALCAIGLFVALYAGSHYEVGRAARMGPGFFPVMLGWLLVGLGLLIVLLSFRRRVQALTPPPFRLRPLLAVLAAVAVFSLLIGRLGLVPATVALTFVAALGERQFKLRRTALLAVFLALLVWLTFTLGLGMQLPAFSFAFGA